MEYECGNSVFHLVGFKFSSILSLFKMLMDYTDRQTLKLANYCHDFDQKGF